MSKTQKEASSVERGEQTGDSVYDFLYYDSERIASYLAQFDTSGHLKEVSLSEGKTEVVSKAHAIEGNIKIPPFTGDYAFNKKQEEGDRKDGRLTYDPSWTNALTFLDYLNERGFLQRDITKAPIGSFVLHSGGLHILDMEMLRKTCELKSVKDLIRSEIRGDAKAKQNQKNAEQEVKLSFELMSTLPYSICLRLFGTLGEAWGCLNPESLATPTSTLTLNHGSVIPGNWNLLGVVDAKPGPIVTSEIDQEDTLSSVFSIINPLARMLLGRPDNCFGVTPLLVFREVSDS